MAEAEIITLLKPRFKAYLEGAFRQIAPTQAAMEYRKQLLTRLLDRAQELDIRGLKNPDLVFKTAIDELGDMSELLEEFEGREKRKGELKHKLSTGTIIAIAAIALIALIYVIVGAATGVWHPTWLLLVAGIFGGALLLMVFASLKLVKKRKYAPVRVMLAAAEVLVSVFVFLVLQLVFKIEGSWLTFLAMVALILGADAAFAFLIDSKLRWIELPIFIEVLCVMLYVILGIALDPINHVASIWHPGWMLCLGGVAVALAEFIAMMVKRARAREKREAKQDEELNERLNEAYWSEWDD